jgi:hypothetical protein
MSHTECMDNSITADKSMPSDFHAVRTGTGHMVESKVGCPYKEIALGSSCCMPRQRPEPSPAASALVAVHGENENTLHNTTQTSVPVTIAFVLLFLVWWFMA